MSRLQFFKLRVVPTGVSLLIAIALVRLLWFPGAYFSISGVGKLVVILVAVNLVVGPVLSAFVYRHGKPRLGLDLGILAGVELLALVVALAALYARQPWFTVFAVDRFESVMQREVDTTQLQHSQLLTRPGHEPRLVYAQLPQDQKVLEQLMEETLFQGRKDIDRRPEFWLPYAAGIPTIKAAARPLRDLVAADDGRAAKVERWLAGREAAEYSFLPIRGRAGDATMILHADIGYPVAVIGVDPW